jgi:hypothetical protein
MALKQFRDAPPCSLRGAFRQRIAREEPRGFDFPVWLRLRQLPPTPRNENGNVISSRHMAIEKESMQLRLAIEHNVAFLAQLPAQGTSDRLAGLDATPRQMPARDVGVTNQKYAALPIDDERAHPQRQAAGKSPVDVKTAPQQRLQLAMDGGRSHVSFMNVSMMNVSLVNVSLVNVSVMPDRVEAH